MRTLKTTPTELREPAHKTALREPSASSEPSAADKEIVRRVSEALLKPEACELETGKLLVEIRPILERDGVFWAFLKRLPFTERTAYRRIKTYERAVEMWPMAVVDAAIARKLPIIASTSEKPMGVYEALPSPPRVLSPRKIEAFLQLAEIEARLGANQKKVKTGDPYALLQSCFQFVARSAQSLPSEDRRKFLVDLVGLEMTLLGVNEAKRFDPVKVPSDFWLHGGAKSPETRARISEAASARWARVRAQAQAKEDGQ